VLLEAGEGLGKQTKGDIQMSVNSAPAGKVRFTHQCLLSVPALNYRYPLFTVEERGDPYPVWIFGDAVFEKGVPAANEAALLENLRLLFRADSTKHTVLQLLEMLQ
jgi:hypothetical protein